MRTGSQSTTSRSTETLAPSPVRADRSSRSARPRPGFARPASRQQRPAASARSKRVVAPDTGDVRSIYVHTRTFSRRAVRRSPIQPPPSTSRAPDHGSSGSRACSRTATALARAATSAARSAIAGRPDHRAGQPQPNRPPAGRSNRPRKNIGGPIEHPIELTSVCHDQLTHPRRSTPEQLIVTITNSRNITSSGVF